MPKAKPAAAADTLLIELLTEELPPKALRTFDLNFYSSILEDLVKLGFVAATVVPEHFATPRRLAVVVPAVRAKQLEQSVERKGPSITAALDAAGKPTSALLGFAKSCGAPVEQLDRAKDAKGEYFVFRSMKPGETLPQHLAAILQKAIKKLPAPKVMRWGDGDTRFVRPVHGLLVIHGSKPLRLPEAVLGFTAGTNRTRGHRFIGK